MKKFYKNEVDKNDIHVKIYSYDQHTQEDRHVI
jgi:hypothetical protein